MLLEHMQMVYGTVGYELSQTEASALGAALAPGAVPPPSATPRDCRQSVYRCLICLGDLARCALPGVNIQGYSAARLPACWQHDVSLSASTLSDSVHGPACLHDIAHLPSVLQQEW